MIVSLKFIKAHKKYEYECLHCPASAFMASEWVVSIHVESSSTAAHHYYCVTIFIFPASSVNDYARNFWNFCSSTQLLNTQYMLPLATANQHFFFCSGNICKQTWSCCIRYFGKHQVPPQARTITKCMQ